MFAETITALQKMQRSAEMVRYNFKQYWAKGQPLGMALPHAVHQAIATAFFIQAVALLDDALVRYIEQEHEERPERETLYGRLHFLNERGLLYDSEKLRAVRDARNSLAHDPGVFATWEDYDEAHRVVSAQLVHLRIVPKETT